MSSGDEITQSTPLLQERTNEQPSQANKTSQATDRGSSIPRRGDVEQGFGVTLIPPDNQRALEEARATLVCCCMLLVLAVVLFAILGPYFHFWNKRNPPICHSDRNYYTSAFLSVFLGYFGIDRFYLGYTFLGLLKFCTGGFAGIMWVVDVVLIIVGGLPDGNGCALS